MKRATGTFYSVSGMSYNLFCAEVYTGGYNCPIVFQLEPNSIHFIACELA